MSTPDEANKVVNPVGPEENEEFVQDVLGENELAESPDSSDEVDGITEEVNGEAIAAREYAEVSVGKAIRMVIEWDTEDAAAHATWWVRNCVENNGDSVLCVGSQVIIYVGDDKETIGRINADRYRLLMNPMNKADLRGRYNISYYAKASE